MRITEVTVERLALGLERPSRPAGDPVPRAALEATIVCVEECAGVSLRLEAAHAR